MKEDDIIFVRVFNLLTKRFKYVFLSIPKIILKHLQFIYNLSFPARRHVTVSFNKCIALLMILG